MVHDLFQVVWINRVEDVEEVLPVGRLLICVFVLEEDVEGLVILQVGPELLY